MNMADTTLTNEQLDRLIMEAAKNFQTHSTGGNYTPLLMSIAASNLAIVELLQRLLEVKIRELDTGRGDNP